MIINSLAPGRCDPASKRAVSEHMLQINFMSTFYEIARSCECHRICLMVSQHWFRQWLGAIRQQAITWPNVEPGPCRHKTSLELMIRCLEMSCSFPWLYYFKKQSNFFSPSINFIQSLKEHLIQHDQKLSSRKQSHDGSNYQGQHVAST